MKGAGECTMKRPPREANRLPRTAARDRKASAGVGDGRRVNFVRCDRLLDHEDHQERHYGCSRIDDQRPDF